MRILEQWLAACRNRLEDGRPGCVAVFGNFRPGLDAPNGFVLLNQSGGFVQVTGIALHNGRIEPHGRALSLESLASQHRISPDLTPGDIAAALDGAFEITPAGINALQIGDTRIIPEN